MKPKYFSPSSIVFSSKGKFCWYRLFSFCERQKEVRVDFPSFIIIPVALEKSFTVLFRVSASPFVPDVKMRISSTKRRCVICRLLEILMPGKEPERFFAARALLRPSTTRRKSSGERGHPCLKPLSGLKKVVAEPFMSTEKDTIVMQHIIHLIKGTVKARCV